MKPPSKSPSPAPGKLPFMRRITRRQLERFSVIAILAGLAGLAGLLSFWLVRSTVAGLPVTAAGPAFQAGDSAAPGADPAAAGEAPAANPNQPQSMPTLTPWDGAGRVTVLLIGLDYRDWSADEGPSRSDTMILLTLDPQTKTAGVLSIPRDMWVAIPGFQHGKINTAYYLGEAYKLPGGGPGLAVKTVEQFLGVPVNYYAQVDFNAFVQFIDEIGGVKIDVPEKIKIDLLGTGHRTIKTLQPGVQTLPGEWALAYARNRYTEGGDFDRAARQQQVILAIRDRVLSLDMLPTLVSKAPTLYNQLASGVHTNLTLDQVIRLAVLAQEVPENQIVRGILDENTVVFGRSPDDLSILIPIPDKITLVRDQVFASSGALGPQTPGDTLQRARAEAARVAVYNGSSTAGLAERTAEYLRSQGLNVVQVGDAGQRYSGTTLVDHSGSPYAIGYLADLMNIRDFRLQLEMDLNAPYDLELYLGDDWAVSGNLP